MGKSAAFVLACVLVLSQGKALAQPSPSPEQQAAAAFERGKAAYRNNDYPTALVAFEEAMRLAPHDVVRFNVALCLERLGRYSEALERYRALTASAQLDEATRQTVATRIPAVQQRLGTLSIVGGDGATVSVDAADRCTAPCQVELDPGPHAVRVEGAGVEMQSRVELRSGETTEVEVHATEQGEPVPQPIPLPPPRRDDRGLRVGILGWVGAGVAVVGVAGGVAFGLRAQGLHDDFLADPTTSRADQGDLAVTLANVSIGVAAVGMATFLVDLLLIPSGDSSAGERETIAARSGD